MVEESEESADRPGDPGDGRDGAARDGDADEGRGGDGRDGAGGIDADESGGDADERGTDAGEAGTDAPAGETGIRTDETGGPADAPAVPDPEELLDRLGFAAERSVLTRRQAEVFALRERGVRQAAIAERLGTSRANVSSVEASARANVEKARETVAFADALTAPVRVEVEAGRDLYDVPRLVYDACDEAGVKVARTAPDLMAFVSESAGEAVRGREIRAPLVIGVTPDGDVRVRRSER